VRADNRQLGKVLVQTFNISQPPVLDIEHYSLGMIPGNIVPQFFVRTGDQHRKVGAQSTSQGLGHPRIFFENNNTLSHTFPDLQASSTADVNAR